MSTSKRLASTVIENDRATLVALQSLEDYAAVNPAHSRAALEQLANELAHAAQAEAHARHAFEAARDLTISLEHRFHETIGGAKNQVIAQYGPNSTAVSAIGLKKRSEHKRPARRSSTTA